MTCKGEKSVRLANRISGFDRVEALDLLELPEPIEYGFRPYYLFDANTELWRPTSYANAIAEVPM